MIITKNDGARIVESNYWDSEMAARGYCYVSPNAGTLRLLLPPSLKRDIADMRMAEEIVVTRGIHNGGGSWPQYAGRDMTELLFDDHSNSPYMLLLSLEQWERLPNLETDYNRTWEFTAWEDRRGTPHRVLTKLSFLRNAPLPCMQSWG